MSIDPKFVELTADVVTIFFIKNRPGCPPPPAPPRQAELSQRRLPYKVDKKQARRRIPPPPPQKERIEVRNAKRYEKRGMRKGVHRDMRGVNRRDKNEKRKAHLHSPMDFAKTLKLRYRVGGLDLPERIKRFAGSPVEGEGAQRCPRGNADESRTRIAGECELYKGERDVLEEKLGTLDSREKTIAILGVGWWPQTAIQEGDEKSMFFFNVVYGGNVMGAQLLVSLLLLQ